MTFKQKQAEILTLLSFYRKSRNEVREAKLLLIELISEQRRDISTWPPSIIRDLLIAEAKLKILSVKTRIMEKELLCLETFNGRMRAVLGSLEKPKQS